MPPGSLVVVGTGIKFLSHITVEARGAIERAEKVFFLINEPASAVWIQRLNPSAESLAPFYVAGKRRLDIYHAMAAHILATVRQGMRVCAVFYGHPGVFVTPAHEALRQARHEGFRAWMAPGISAEDCLFADLEIDPAHHGCQSFEATDFLVHKRRFDPTSNLILWQVGVAGELFFKQDYDDRRGLQLLADVLVGHYGADHRGVIYEAAQYPAFDPLVEWVPLRALPSAPITPVSTLYVPPRAVAEWDTEAISCLKIDWVDLIAEEE